MQFLGNIPAGQAVDFKFHTHKADGTPIALASGVVKIYKDNATATEVTTGVTLTADFDSVTGLNHVRVVTTDAFYAAGSDYTAIITTGTVDGVRVIGTVLAQWSIAHRDVDTAGTTELLERVPDGVLAKLDSILEVVP